MLLREIYDLRKENVTEDFARQIGWERWVLAPAEIVRTTLLLTMDIRKQIGKEMLKESYLWNHVDFTASNRRDREYGKTFDRMLFLSSRADYTVISNMTGSGAKYLIFHYNKPTPIKKASNRKALIEFLAESFSENGSFR